MVSGLRPELGRFGIAEPEAQGLVDEIEAQAHSPAPNGGLLKRLVEKLLDLAAPLGLRMFADWLRFEAQKRGILPPN